MEVTSYNLTNLDANENIFFARELEHIKSATFDVDYPDLLAEQMIPVSTEVDEGAASWTYEQYDHVGVAKLIANYADDLPRSDVKGTEHNQPVVGIGSSYGYNMQEVRAAKMAGKPLDAKRAKAARESDARKRDALACTGDTAANLKGFFNNSNVTELTAGSKTGGGTTWISATATADEILADLNSLYNRVRNDTKGVEKIDTIALPILQFQKINDMPRSSTSDTTVKEFWEKTHPGVKIVEWPKLDGAASDSSDLMIGYRKSADKVVMEIPMAFQQHAPQPKGLEFVVSCESRFGGVVFFKPLSACYMKGV